MIKILIVDDHDELRLGLSLFFQKHEDLTVVGEADNGRFAVELARKLRPDIVLMDVEMPVMDGIEACKIIRKELEEVKVVMLTSHDNDEHVLTALAARANGYCLKQVIGERLVTAIRTVNEGDMWLDSSIAAGVVRMLPTGQKDAAAPRPKGAGDAPYEALSRRELEILKLIADGHSNTEISQLLIISKETVKTHIRHLMEKLAVSDRTQAAVKALRRGII